MSPAAAPPLNGIRRFRARLFLAMMVVVSVLTSLGIYIAQRRAADDAQADLQRDFQLELTALHRLQDLRNAAVADRSKALAQNARLHAALEDNALDLLYPSAREELRDLMEPGGVETAETLHARFYRFLDSRGAVLEPPNDDAGTLSPNEQSRLSTGQVPADIQTGYLARRDERSRPSVEEIIAVPIYSSETGEPIAALVLGFEPVEAIARDGVIGMKSGILADGELRLADFSPAIEETIAQAVSAEVTRSPTPERSLALTIEKMPHLLFFKKLNAGSAYPAAYEVCLYPLARLLAQQARLRWQILGGGAGLLLGGLVVSHILSRRLSQPVEELAVVSEENLAQRQRAEAALRSTAEELQRSARFSADASHQLKSPITVLRAGLDGLLARDGFPEEVYEEISGLIHQTYRLTGVVEDLLLLSRMDAGKLRLSLHPVDLRQLVAEWSDDLQAMPDAAGLQIESDLPEDLSILGEVKFTALIVQNLLDNARKYNRSGGVIRVVGRCAEAMVELHVGNTGRGIPREAQAFVFERFHRGGASEEVPGHGLGLNLARELARLHGGELALVRAEPDWTEFRVVFRAAAAAIRGKQAS